MKHVLLLALGAWFGAACGGVDETGLEGSGEPTASKSEAIINDWTPWMSEEPPANFATCGGGDASGATGAQCSGSFCDNMRLYCGPLPAGFTRTSTNIWWSPNYVSEEQPGGVGCPNDMVLDGIRATGLHSDNISIRCSPTTFPPQGVNCKWMPFFSEEQGTQFFDYDPMSVAVAVAVAVKCSGSYCDNLSFFVCEPRCTKNSDCFSACNVTTGRCVVG